MATKYSNEYTQLMKEISRSYIPTQQKISRDFWFVDHEEKNERIAFTLAAIVCLTILCAISCIFHLIFASVISALNILIIFVFLVILGGLVFFIPFFNEKIRGPILDLKKGDEIFYYQEKTCHCAVAGYFYYSAKIRGNKLASKRLDMLLKTPELLEFFSINGLAEKQKTTKVSPNTFLGIKSVEISDYRAFVTEYYGKQLKKPKEYELFYESNSYMFSSQIANYDEIENETHYEIENLKFDGLDLYSLAYDYHFKWFMGDESSRILFKKIYLSDEVIAKHKEHIKNMKNNRGIIYSRSEDSLAFDMLMNKVVDLKVD